MFINGESIAGQRQRAAAAAPEPRSEAGQQRPAAWQTRDEHATGTSTPRGRARHGMLQHQLLTALGHGQILLPSRQSHSLHLSSHLPLITPSSVPRFLHLVLTWCPFPH
ncbi:hypothetical protein EYF80_057291 [Liparis tanakae]|uniref:Uncharacterized protein n=1 Tax=Liparis tanakae TaxID=230148 RepID=A0A4Z2EUE4_9TELE|nr:hypothetical protein EYF80_057291 [Liparis tanakae]